MKTKNILTKLIQGKNLTSTESRGLFLDVFRSKLPESRVKSILLLLAKKGETAKEIYGCVEALNRLEKKIPCPIKGVMDTCGTGGDNSQSINVSTLSALVIAGAGGRVAKHGNRAISSKCGSSDLMEALGVRLNAKPKQMLKSLDKHGIGYFHAPYYHPIFAKVQPLRQKLKQRTIFNFLGPMVNPLKIDYQLVGVSKLEMLGIYSYILAKKKIKNAWVCHASDGMDEISIFSSTKVVTVSGAKKKTLKINPRPLGFKNTSKATVHSGRSLQSNLRFSTQLLKGKITKSAALDMVLLNAGAGLFVSGHSRSLKEGIELAKESIFSGNALKALEGLKKVSRQS